MSEHHNNDTNHHMIKMMHTQILQLVIQSNVGMLKDQCCPILPFLNNLQPWFWQLKKCCHILWVQVWAQFFQKFELAIMILTKFLKFKNFRLAFKTWFGCMYSLHTPHIRNLINMEFYNKLKLKIMRVYNKLKLKCMKVSSFIRN